jgi:hypothetical protein
MSWLTVISALIKLALTLVQYAQQRQQLQAGEALAISEALKETNARIAKARAARAAVDVGGLPDDDPNLRD